MSKDTHTQALEALRMLADWADANVADPALTGPLGYARAALAAAEVQPVAVPPGATHYQPHQKAYYQRVSATEWRLWSDRYGWMQSKGTSDSSEWVTLEQIAAAPIAPVTAAQPVAVPSGWKLRTYFDDDAAWLEISGPAGRCALRASRWRSDGTDEGVSETIASRVLCKFGDALAAAPAAPAPALVPLTRDQIAALDAGCGRASLHWDTRVSLARAVERAHGIEAKP